MRRFAFLITMLSLVVAVAQAQYKVRVTKTNGEVVQYPTTYVSKINWNNQGTSSSPKYKMCFTTTDGEQELVNSEVSKIEWLPNVYDENSVTFYTGSASSITCFSAKAKVSVTPNVELAYTTLSYGVCYTSSDEDPTTRSMKVQGPSTGTAWVAQFTALEGNTTYKYRPYAVVDGHTYYGETKSFTTKADDVVSTGTLSDTYAVVGNKVTISGGTYETLTMGVCYSAIFTAPQPDKLQCFSVGTRTLDENNMFSVQLDVPDDFSGPLYYRAYVKIDGVTHLGDVKYIEVSKETEPEPTPTAQGYWPVPTDGETVRYLYNIETKSFLLGANEWETRASVNTRFGYQIKVRANDNGTYSISDYCHTNANEDWGWRGMFADDASGIWVDNSDGANANSWIITPVAGETNVYEISNPSAAAGKLGVKSVWGNTRLYLSSEAGYSTRWAFLDEDGYNSYVQQNWDVVPAPKYAPNEYCPVATDGKTEQYLYNIDTKTFLLGANDWETRASVSSELGYKFKARANGDGTYTLSDYCHTHGNEDWDWRGMFLDAYGIWVDNSDGANANSWVITPVAGETNVYEISNPSAAAGKLGVMSDLSNTRLFLTSQSGYSTRWAFINVEQSGGGETIEPDPDPDPEPEPEPEPDPILGPTAEGYWPVATDGETEQYIYNIETRSFLLGANDWQTRASVSREEGYKFKVRANGDGTYTLSDYCHTYLKQDWAWRGMYAEAYDKIWVDNSDGANADSWVITPVAGETNVYEISNPSAAAGKLGVKSDLSDTRLYLTSQLGYSTRWAFLDKEGYAEHVGETTDPDPEPDPVVHEYVDLGLPSGTLWATCNVGAESPADYGDYFAWGETKEKFTYDWSTYKYCNGSSTSLTKYCINSSYGMVDDRLFLDDEDDAAYVNWGSDWRMPTDFQLEELRELCTWTWTIMNGRNGYLVTSQTNGRSIFLPAAGYRVASGLYDRGSCYWSRSLYTGYSGWAVGLHGADWNSDDRYYGRSVRPVRKQADPVPTAEGYWPVETDVEKELYLYNIETKSFLLGANDWQTRASVSRDKGYKFSVRTHVSGACTLLNYCHTYAKEDWAWRGMYAEAYDKIYVDNINGANANSWFITPVEGEPNVYEISNPWAATGKLGVKSDLSDTSLYLTSQLGYSTRWVFLDKDGYDSYIAKNKNGTTDPEPFEPEYVDLGLPSGTLWATCNVGASAPEDYGDYFAWGETKPKDAYEESTYKWYYTGGMSKYYNSSSGTGKTELEDIDDAAYVNWGSDWCMPTSAQLEELHTRCRWTLTTRNGKPVYKVMSRTNNRFIILPIAGYRKNSGLYEDSVGYLWSRSLYCSDNISSYYSDGKKAYDLIFNSNGFVENRSDERCYGLSVRPVRKK